MIKEKFNMKYDELRQLEDCVQNAINELKKVRKLKRAHGMGTFEEDAILRQLYNSKKRIGTAIGNNIANRITLFVKKH